jgi:O-antigen/teichoic acid export membrane protein
LFKNLLFNYASNIFLIVAGIVCVPIYYHLLGPVEFSTVGLFLICFPLLSNLDLGLGTATMQQVARFKVGNIDRQSLRDTLVGIQIVFLSLVLITLLVILIEILSTQAGIMVDVSNNRSIVDWSLGLMFLSIGLRWISIFYRSCVIGLEEMQWLATFNIVTTALRFFGVAIFLLAVASTSLVFCSYQVVISVCELLLLYFKTAKHLPSTIQFKRLNKAFDQIRQIGKFASIVGIGGFVWVILAQFDKAFLTRTLSKAEYGKFTLVILMASLVSAISGPVNLVLLPRLVSLHASANNEEFISTYKMTTQLVATLSSIAAMIMIFMSKPLFFLWTGQDTATSEMQYMIALYALGNLLLGFSVFGHFLQIAKNNVSYYLVGVGLFGATWIGLALLFYWSFGVVGVAMAWTSVNTLYLAFWIPFINAKLAPELGSAWFFKDILSILIAVALAVALCRIGLWDMNSKLTTVLGLGFTFSVAATSAVLVSSSMQQITQKLFRLLMKSKR